MYCWRVKTAYSLGFVNGEWIQCSNSVQMQRAKGVKVQSAPIQCPMTAPTTSCLLFPSGRWMMDYEARVKSVKSERPVAVSDDMSALFSVLGLSKVEADGDF